MSFRSEGRVNVFADRPAEPAGLNAGHAGLPIGKNTAVLFAVLLALGLAGCEAKKEAGKQAEPPREKVVYASKLGYDPADATQALQLAIASGAQKVVVENRGTPWIVDKIQLADDQEVFFEKGVVVQAKRGAFKGTGDCLFTARLKKNVTLNGYGATFKMWKEDYHGQDY